MGNQSATSAEVLDDGDFDRILSMYPAFIDSIPNAKPGQKTLAELDKFRYDDAIELFSKEPSKRVMKADDVNQLVEWKLHHGKFRPTLMSLVKSNPEDTIQKIIAEAVEFHRVQGDTQAALKTLCKLRGIGPATASLLLSVHDPENVIFFSDEAYYWLCGDGKKVPLKYSAKEYEQLQSEARGLQQRLKVSALDIERVAYVVMRMSQGELDSILSAAVPQVNPAQPTSKKIDETADADTLEASKQSAVRHTAKRKAGQGMASPIDEAKLPARRSKRLRDQAGK